MTMNKYFPLLSNSEYEEVKDFIENEDNKIEKPNKVKLILERLFLRSVYHRNIAFVKKCLGLGVNVNVIHEGNELREVKTPDQKILGKPAIIIVASDSCFSPFNQCENNS